LIHHGLDHVSSSGHSTKKARKPNTFLFSAQCNAPTPTARIIDNVGIAADYQYQSASHSTDSERNLASDPIVNFHATRLRYVIQSSRTGVAFEVPLAVMGQFERHP
jgi:hypothetical protein